MFPAATINGGMCMVVPDVCNTPAPPGPPIPFPYLNKAQLNQTNPSTASGKVLICCAQAFHKGSTILLSSGDEAGSLGGVASGLFMGPAKPKKGSSKVKVQGQPLVYLTCVFGQNGTNSNVPNGMQVSPSQNKVLVSS